MQVLNPVGPPGRAHNTLAPSPGPGGRISLLSNGKPNALAILGVLRELLIEELSLVEGATFDKTVDGRGSGAIAPDWVLDALASDSAVVLTGSGDCGGCSSWSIEDSAALETRNVATVMLCTDVFEPLVRNLSAGLGFADLPIAVLAHPLGTRTPENLREVAREILPQVLTGLRDARATKECV